MSWAAIAWALFQIVLLGLKIYYEKDQEKRQKAAKLRKEFKDALKNKDYGALGLLLDRAKRL